MKVSLDIVGKVMKDAGMRYRVLETNGNVEGKRRVVSEGALGNVSVPKAGGRVEGSIVLDGKGYKLWWPNGLGKQNLYDVEITVVDASGEVLAEVRKRTGFRTIVMNMGEVTEEEIEKGVAKGSHCEQTKCLSSMRCWGDS